MIAPPSTAAADVQLTTSAPRDDSVTVEALRPVRDALLADAAREAERLVADARRRTEERITVVEQDVEDEVAAEQRRAQDSAAARRAQAAARAQTRAHRSMMQRRRGTHDDLVASVRAAVRALRDDPRYPELLRHFEEEARAQLGADAVVTVDPDPDGGVVATSGPRRVDYTLTALADRALASLADDVASLWA